MKLSKINMLLAAAIILAAATATCPTATAAAGLNFGRTLRCDYVFTGNSKSAEIAVSELRALGPWAGRRVNMDSVPLRGDGQIVMRDAASGEVLYMTSFSTLFQEWQSTEEATRMRKSFENVFLLPMPAAKAEITVTLYDTDGNKSCTFTHPVDPADILIRPVTSSAPDYKYLHKGGSTEDCIDVAIVAEGYTAAERETFYADAQTVVEALWQQEPFASLKDRFNIVAIALDSRESGISMPAQGLWKDTAALSNFDTFYSSRYLTTTHLFRLHDAIAAVSYEHLIILANTTTYGGGGIYNSYTLTNAHHNMFSPVVVHEFGHSFAGLADEYYYDDQYEERYKEGTEPWEPNITTMADFASKWESLLPDASNISREYTAKQQKQVARSSQAVRKAYATAPSGKIVGRDEVSWPEFEVGLYEGGGYRSKGVWRGYQECRMKINEYPEFCPVCQRAIRNMIDFYTIQR